MAAQTLVRDGLEAVFVVGVGGMLVSAVRRLRAGEVRAHRCGACGRPTSRAYPRCKHCGAPVLSRRGGGYKGDVTERTVPSRETRAAEQAAAGAEHGATEPPTPEEEAAAERSRGSVDDEVRADYRDMVERGAQQQGEGRIP